MSQTVFVCSLATLTYTMTGVWMTIELNLGIIAANLALMRGVITFFKRKLFPKSTTTYGSKSNGTPAYAQYTFGSGPARHHASATSGRRMSGATDRSEIPLKLIMQTKEVVLAESEAQSSSEAADDIEHRWAHAK